jgi:hypothetical protein
LTATVVSVSQTAALLSVPGAGANCKPHRFVPSKRIKALHRSRVTGTSLKAFARSVDRAVATTAGPWAMTDFQAAHRWLASKGVRL